MSCNLHDVRRKADRPVNCRFASILFLLRLRQSNVFKPPAYDEGGLITTSGRKCEQLPTRTSNTLLTSILAQGHMRTVFDSSSGSPSQISSFLSSSTSQCSSWCTAASTSSSVATW